MKDSFEEYEIMLEKELLVELGAEAMGYFSRYFKKKNINYKDEKQPLVILSNKIFMIKHDLYGSKYNTIEELNQAKGFFKGMIDYVKKLEEIENGHI